MTKNAPLQEFFTRFQYSLEADRFIKIKLGAYHGLEPELKTIEARKILVKGHEKLSFTYHYTTRDIVKNYSFEESGIRLEQALAGEFYTAILYTTEADFHLELLPGKPARLKPQAASTQSIPSLGHDRAKHRFIAAEGNLYLQALKVTDVAGTVLASAQDKFRQINKYIEILSGLIKSLAPQERLRVVDMGSGKGYLTFALYDYLVQTLGLKVEVTGVEYRQELVDFCNRLAEKSGFEHLHFVQGAIAQYDCTGADIVIALHACDTATDDAIAKAIQADAGLIVVAPCCHKQIRRQMERKNVTNELGFMLKHGTLLERQAEMVTDGMRAQLMEYCGYSTKLFEFISDAHTPKNVMIVGAKTAKRPQNHPKQLAAIQQTKAYFGIDSHYLESRLGLDAKAIAPTGKST